MSSLLPHLTDRDLHRVGEFLRADFDHEQFLVRLEVVDRGKARARMLAGIFRRCKLRNTTFNDWASSSYREENARAIREAFKETA